MLARTLTLECPRGQTGNETIKSEGPTRLPEARRAIQAGKLPRKAGLTLVRHATSTTDAAGRDAGRQRGQAAGPRGVGRPGPLEERVARLRHLIETLDLLYDAFGRVRFSGDWAKELGRMQRWLSREERQAA